MDKNDETKQPRQRLILNWRKLFRASRRRWAWAVVAAATILALVTALLAQTDLQKLVGTAGQARPTATRVAAPVTPQPAVKVTANDSTVFVENVGQFDKAARFQVRGHGHTLWLTENAVWVTALEGITGSKDSQASARSLAASRKGMNVKLSFPGANPTPRLEPYNRLDMHLSYFIGSDPAGWRMDVPVWGGVRYIDLYPGVDLEISGEGDRWNWRLVARQPQFDMANVRLRVEGADMMSLESPAPAGGEARRLRLSTAVGDLRLPLLDADQASAPSISAERDVVNPFTSPLAPPLPEQVAEPQDNLPGRLYATFLGGDNAEWGYGIAVDKAGCAYVTGETWSVDFPTTPGAFDAGGGHNEVLVAKLNSTGSALDYAAILGGSGADYGQAIAVDEAGYAYVAGRAGSSDFPVTPGVAGAVYGGSDDAFVIKLNPTGSALEYATFLGGSGSERAAGIAVDGTGSACVVGNTRSENFPITPGALDTTFNGADDVFVARLNPSGSALTYATYLGGQSNETAGGLALDGAGRVYLTGETFSADFPVTPGALDTTYTEPYAAFVVKLNPDGSALDYATFLGRNGSAYGQAIAVDEAGSAYITGSALSSDFPTTPGAFDTTFDGPSAAFVVKLNPAGSALEYATYLGGSGSDDGYAIAVDRSGNAYVTGDTGSADWPATRQAFDATFSGDNGEAFVAKLNSRGSALAYATLLGGSGDDHSRAIAVDKAGGVYVTGYTSSADFPVTSGAFDTTYNNGAAHDAFVARLPIQAAYSISGQVTDSDGRPLSGVTVSDNAGHVATTDGRGYYTLSDLEAGTYTITPFKAGYVLAAAARTLSLPPEATDQNWTLVESAGLTPQVYVPFILNGP